MAAALTHPFDIECLTFLLWNKANPDLGEAHVSTCARPASHMSECSGTSTSSSLRCPQPRSCDSSLGRQSLDVVSGWQTSALSLHSRLSKSVYNRCRSLRIPSNRPKCCKCCWQQEL